MPPLAQDAATLQTVELPAQTTAGELTFQIPLLPSQTRIVTIAYADAAAIDLLRTPPPRVIETHGMVVFAGLLTALSVSLVTFRIVGQDHLDRAQDC